MGSISDREVLMKKCIHVLFGVAILATVAMAKTDDLFPTPSLEPKRAAQPVLPMQELYAMVNKPIAPKALLENIKLLVEKGFLVRDDFYIDEVISRFFGDGEILRNVQCPLPGRIGLRVVDFGATSKYAHRMRLTSTLAVIDFGYYGEKNKRVGYVRMNFQAPTQSALGFSDLTEIFGQDWHESVLIQPHPTSPPLLMPTLIYYRNSEFSFTKDVDSRSEILSGAIFVSDESI